MATAQGFVTPSSTYSLWGLWPPLSGVMDSLLVPFAFVQHARLDVPTLYPALHDASCLAFCTVGDPPSSVNTRLLVSTICKVVALVALLSGIALSPELQDQYGQHAKNCDSDSVLRVCTSRLFGEPSSSRFPRIRSACTVLLYPSLAGTLSAPSAGTLLPLTIAGISTAEWLSSLGNSPRPPPAPAIYSMVANLALGYAVSWYSTTSLAQAKV